MIFIDEFQSLFGDRDGARAVSACPGPRCSPPLPLCASGVGCGAAQGESTITSQLLLELTALRACDGVVLLAATNHPSMIDASLLRPGVLAAPLSALPLCPTAARVRGCAGRFDKLLEVGLPSEAERTQHLVGPPLVAV